MNRQDVVRVSLAGAGVGLAAVGVSELLGALRTPAAAVPVAARWLAGPVLLDLALVPLVAVVAVALRRRLPAAWFRPVAAASVVSLLVTAVALPFVAGVGRRADNPTLLDRPYVTGWLGILTVVWVVAIGAGLGRHRRLRPRGSPL